MRRSELRKMAAFTVIGLAVLGGSGGKAHAQAIGFQPIITPIPSGASLTVTPVVTADRRYVRMGLTPSFTSLRGVDTFSFGAGAVSGGGGFGGFGGGGFGGGFGGGGFGNGGAGGGGLASIAPQADPNNPAIIPAAFRQGNQGGAAGNNGNNGVAVIPGLAAVGSGWGFPYYGLPAYGYGYGLPGYGYGYGYPAGYPFNNSFYSYAYYDVTNGGFYAPIYAPPQTVNGMGNVMGAIIQSAGGRR